MTNTELATWLHDNYEGLAKAFQWETQESTRVPFEELPIKNRTTMLALANRMNNTFLIIARQADVISWVAVENGLPDELETVWISNGKGWTTLGCIVYAEGGWHWAETNGVIYQENDKIVSECESDDLDVKFWHRLPKPPCL